jgi:hypothetical protein
MVDGRRMILAEAIAAQNHNLFPMATKPEDSDKLDETRPII